MRRIRYVLLLLLMVVCTNGGIKASAADERLGTIVDGSLLTDGTSAEYENAIGSSLARSKYLNYGYGNITQTSSGTVALLGETVCTQKVDAAKVRIYLQKLVGSSWTTVYTSSTKVAYNAYYVATSATKSVTGGYYYRISGVHIVTHDGTTETVSSYSNGIWVD